MPSKKYWTPCNDRPSVPHSLGHALYVVRYHADVLHFSTPLADVVGEVVALAQGVEAGGGAVGWCLGPVLPNYCCESVVVLMPTPLRVTFNDKSSIEVNEFTWSIDHDGAARLTLGPILTSDSSKTLDQPPLTIGEDYRTNPSVPGRKPWWFGHCSDICKLEPGHKAGHVAWDPPPTAQHALDVARHAHTRIDWCADALDALNKLLAAKTNTLVDYPQFERVLKRLEDIERKHGYVAPDPVEIAQDAELKEAFKNINRGFESVMTGAILYDPAKKEPIAGFGDMTPKDGQRFEISYPDWMKHTDHTGKLVARFQLECPQCKATFTAQVDSTPTPSDKERCVGIFTLTDDNNTQQMCEGERDSWRHSDLRDDEPQTMQRHTFVPPIGPTKTNVMEFTIGCEQCTEALRHGPHINIDTCHWTPGHTHIQDCDAPAQPKDTPRRTFEGVYFLEAHTDGQSEGHHVSDITLTQLHPGERIVQGEGLRVGKKEATVKYNGRMLYVALDSPEEEKEFSELGFIIGSFYPDPKP